MNEKSKSESGVNILEWNSGPIVFHGLQVARHEHYNQKVYPGNSLFAPGLAITMSPVPLLLRFPVIHGQLVQAEAGEDSCCVYVLIYFIPNKMRYFLHVVAI